MISGAGLGSVRELTGDLNFEGNPVAPEPAGKDAPTEAAR